MNVQKYNKAIVSLLGMAGTIAPLINPDLAFVGDPEFQASLVAVVTPFLVYLIPNKTAA